MSAVTGRDAMKRFEEAGLVPLNCRRIIIDMVFDEAVRVYYECFGDEKVLDLIGPQTLEGARVIAIDRMGFDEPNALASVEELELSARTRSKLKKLGVTTFGLLTECTVRDLQSLPPICFEEITTYLADRGIALALPTPKLTTE